MLKQVSQHRFSKTARLILVILTVMIVLGIIIVMLCRSPEKSIGAQEPLGLSKYSQEIKIS